MKTRYKIPIAAFVGIIAISGIDAFVIEPNIIEINEIDISDAGTEMRTGLVADFQRQNADPAFVSRVVEMINEKNLDVVLIAGDFVDKSIDELPSVEPLKQLQTTHGVYGVLGNHDYSVYFLHRDNANLQMGQKIKDFIESNGNVKILKNESVTINGIAIIGLDSYWAGLRDVDEAFANTSDEFKILFAHNQDGLEIDGDTADVYLFGHTHCGQVRLPYFGSIPKMMGFSGDYDYRHYTVNDADVYTTCGLTPAPRFFNPPEITIINLA